MVCLCTCEYIHKHIFFLFEMSPVEFKTSRYRSITSQSILFFLNKQRSTKSFITSDIINELCLLCPNYSTSELCIIALVLRLLTSVIGVITSIICPLTSVFCIVTPVLCLLTLVLCTSMLFVKSNSYASLERRVSWPMDL